MPRNIPPVQQQMLLNNGKSDNIWTKWFDIISNAVNYIRIDGSIEPVSIADVDAVNNSIYYSTDSSKLVFKDSSGVVNALY